MDISFHYQDILALLEKLTIGNRGEVSRVA